MMKKILLSLGTVILLVGCGGGISSSEIDEDIKKKNLITSNQYVTYFSGNLLTGIWILYDYDENDEPKQNGLGINQKYKYDLDGQISLNISLIDTWIPLGDFELDATNTKISFHEGDESVTKQFSFVEYRDPMPMQYKDENNVTQTFDIPCVKVGKYSIQENNTSLDSFYHMCKES